MIIVGVESVVVPSATASLRRTHRGLNVCVRVRVRVRVCVCMCVLVRLRFNFVRLLY